MDLRDEIEAVLDASWERSEIVQRGARARDHGAPLPASALNLTETLGEILAGHRGALLRIAEEVDRLRADVDDS